jgi:hypothetical protein
MQIDFHHAVTYIVARLAGFSHPDGCTIAYAAQYVDDATNKGTIYFDNGTSYTRIASAHTVFDVDHNCKNKEDYQVWVPFHFLPGNGGASVEQSGAPPVIQRLICTPDSPLANDMWLACRNTKETANSFHRLGITAHVYLDTFAHQLFAGVRHDVNLVFDLKHIEPTCDEILEEFKGSVADALKLGHGAALTDPDLPFLKWNYKNSYRQEQDRDNPAIFSLAAARLFAQFQYYLGVTNQKSMLAQDLNAINDTIKQNVSTDAGARHQRWLALVKAGVFSFGPLSDQETDELGYAADGPGSWKYAALGTSDEPKSPVPYDQNFDSSNWKRFHDALKDHQHEVLNQILPRYGLPSSIQGSI